MHKSGGEMQMFKCPYSKWCEQHKEFAPLALRVGLGVLFLLQGIGKVGNVAGVGGFFTSLGIPSWLAPIVAWTELLGGILLLAGALTRYAAGVLSVIMVVALLTAHRADFFAMKIGGFALVFVSLGGLVALKLLGAGPLSVDSILFKKEHHEEHIEHKKKH